MKKIIVLLLTILPAFAIAQVKYIIRGKINGINGPAVAYLNYAVNQDLRFDSCVMVNGAFYFSGQVDVITDAKLVIVHKPANTEPDVINFYLANGTTVINSPGLLKNATITGTKPNEDAIDYARYRHNRSGLSGREMDSVYIAGHPDSYISLQIIKNTAGETPEYNEVQSEFNRLSAQLRNSEDGIVYQAYLNTLKNTAIGASSPDFTQPDTNGDAVKLSSFRGKYVLIDFWASWCVHCREENPNVVKAYQAFKNKGFTVLSVSLDGPGHKGDWLRAIHQDGLPWTQVSDLKVWDSEVVKLYGITAIPQNLLLDPDGKIIAKNLHGEELQRKLDMIFGRVN